MQPIKTGLLDRMKRHYVFGNDIGLLESDGMEWELYPMPNSPIVRALAVESHYTIYTGGAEELGRWDRDQSGKLKYTSLNKLLPPKVWTMKVSGASG